MVKKSSSDECFARSGVTHLFKEEEPARPIKNRITSIVAILGANAEPNAL